MAKGPKYSEKQVFTIGCNNIHFQITVPPLHLTGPEEFKRNLIAAASNVVEHGSKTQGVEINHNLAQSIRQGKIELEIIPGQILPTGQNHVSNRFQKKDTTLALF